MNRMPKPEVGILMNLYKSWKWFDPHRVFRGCSAAGHGEWGCYDQPVAYPHASQVLLCVGGLSRGEAGLDGKHRELSDEPDERRLPAARLRLCRHLDSRQHLWAVPPLLCQIYCHHAPSPLPQVWLPGVWLVLQTQGGDPPHQHHREEESLQAMPRWGEQGGGDVSAEVGQQWEKLFRRWGWIIPWWIPSNTHHWESVDGHLDDFLVWVPSTTPTVLAWGIELLAS